LALSGAFDPSFQADAMLMGPQDALIEFGKNWWASFANQLYSKVCPEDGVWHQKIVEAVSGGTTTLGITLATMLVSGLGTALAICRNCCGNYCFAVF
jgi:hypothetical protein